MVKIIFWGAAQGHSSGGPIHAVVRGVIRNNRNFLGSGDCTRNCKGNLQTRGDRDSKESGKSIKTKQDSKQLATVGGFQ